MMAIDKYIKTQCGIEKYELLKKRKGFLSKFRFYWFIFAASIRDYFFNKK